MKNLIAWIKGNAASIVITLLAIAFCAIALMYIRYNIYIVEASKIPLIDANKKIYMDGFEHFRDFATLLCGLFTVFIALSAFFGFITYRKIIDEEEKISDRGNRLDMFLKVAEAKYSSDPEWGYVTAIKLYDDAENIYNKDYLVYALRGDTHLLAWKSGKGQRGCPLNFHLYKAKEDFEKAVQVNKSAASALHGLSTTIFQLALSSRQSDEECCVHLNWDIATKLMRCDDDSVLLPLKQQDLPICLKENCDYFGADELEVKKSIQIMGEAIFNGYDETIASLELGAMYEAVGSTELALEKYATAYKSNMVIIAGYSYCYLWVRTKLFECIANANIECEIINELKKTVSILQDVAEADYNYAKAAFALIGFVYLVAPGYCNKDARTAFSKTDKDTMEKLFKTTGSPAYS